MKHAVSSRRSDPTLTANLPATAPTRSAAAFSRHGARRLLLTFAAGTLGLVAGCDATEVGSQCVQNDILAACPVGSNPVLGATAESACGGSFDGGLVTEGASATGQCTSSGACNVLCQFAVPCTCGVETLTRDAIVCTECPSQSCGDSRCEGTERPSCEPGQAGCMPCPEDCAGPSCGDGDCTGSENPDNCPQDCARECVPNAQECIGNILRKCSADGRSSVSIDCAASGMVCNGTTQQCVPAGGCGNGVCESAETSTSCPQDCGSLCAPNAVRCEGTVLVTCSADGKSESRFDCGDSERVCAEGQCRTAQQCGNFVCESGETADSCAVDCAVVCGNDRCDPGENVSTCPRDCAVCGNNVCEGEEQDLCPRDCPVCGNDVCEYGEEGTCPRDCTECGNQVCEAGEPSSCPQDCGVCTPSSRECLGNVLRVCTANGLAYEDFNCSTFQQICGRGQCETPNQCGNGVCETGEDDTSCAIDCREICGNGTCGVGEDFGSCSVDCPPECGDGSCNGNETSASCALDCLATCGNGSCDGAEDRDNCPGDCGFCGNGVCEDGAESPSMHPPAHLVSCLVDCVVTQCQGNADCDDDQSCTSNACVDGVCVYTPSDNLCPANQKCIRFNGCCPDADRDGFADIACGGSDCDDSDADVYPGALEPCGGGDRNCNGVHKPTLRPARRVTNTFSLKSNLAVSRGANGYLVAWTAIPEQASVIEYAAVTNLGALSGDIRTLPQGGSHPDIAYSPTSNRFALVHTRSANQASLQFVEQNGALSDSSNVIEVGPRIASLETGRTMAWMDNTFFVPRRYWDGPWLAVSEAGGVTQSLFSSTNTVPAYGITGGDRIHVLVNATVFKLSPPDLATGATITLRGGHTSYSHARLAWDGAGLAWAVRDGTGVHYERFFPNGYIESTWPITTRALDPVDTATAPGSGDDLPRVGVLLAEGTSNLHLFVRNQDGSEALPPGLIAGGNTVVDPHLFWDGSQFTVFWLAKVNEINQLHYTNVACE